MAGRFEKSGVSGLSADQIHLQFQLSYKYSEKSCFQLDIDIAIPGQGVTAIFGESGSGKTSLLRCIAGLEKSVSGAVHINDELWQNDTMFLPTHKRSLGYVFQEARLFPHYKVKGSLLYGVKGKVDAKKFRGEVSNMLTDYHLRVNQLIQAKKKHQLINGFICRINERDLFYT